MCGIGALKYAMLVYLKLGTKSLKSDSFIAIVSFKCRSRKLSLASLKLLRMIMSH